ncbi:lysozyme [Bryocella elongata]|uniref:Lysozyme n=1 Tax=Bryocella elongata TaxID=863522 RepID=A0A1H5T969_9BACT|nr:GH25 family lysozyme [Bryocella elongata]SEF58708.1 lysozyme [Bryocella elongata]
MAFPAGCIPGVDVSHYSGVVNWPAAASAGESFAFTKASEGLFTTDPTLSPNWDGAKAAGLLRGAYHLLHPGKSGADQATFFLQQLAAANGGTAQLAPGDLPCVLDIEVADGAPADTIVACATTWLNTVEAATGRTPILYTFASFWIGSVEHVPAFARYPLWIAEYGVPAPKGVPKTWADWTLWQYAEQNVPWAAGNADLDAYKGSLASLQAFAGIVADTGP